MPTSLDSNPLKKANYTYENLQVIREYLIDEIRPMSAGPITVEMLKLVEMRLQSIIMSSLDDRGIKVAVQNKKNIRVHV